MDYARLTIPGLLIAGLMLSGCGLVAAGTAGGVTATELEEDDNDFDPLENTEVGQEVDETVDEVVQ